jgi:hypothetical protein
LLMPTLTALLLAGFSALEKGTRIETWITAQVNVLSCYTFNQFIAMFDSLHSSTNIN